jgi:hypothetical protein
MPATEENAIRANSHIIKLQQLCLRNCFLQLVIKQIEIVLIEVDRKLSPGDVARAERSYDSWH